MVNTVKFNITYFTDNDEDEPLETVFSYLDMPPHIAKKYAMDAAEAYGIDNKYTTFEIQQIHLH